MNTSTPAVNSAPARRMFACIAAVAIAAAVTSPCSSSESNLGNGAVLWDIAEKACEQAFPATCTERSASLVSYRQGLRGRLRTGIQSRGPQPCPVGTPRG